MLRVWTTRLLVVLLLAAWVLLGWRVFTPPYEVVTPPLAETLDMVYCEGGEPRGQLQGGGEVAPFYLDRFEVTRNDYARFLEAEPERHPPAGWDSGLGPEGPAAGELPVTGVSLAQARAYARWVGKRLPSAEEWEWGARGRQGLAYPWGSFEQTFVANTLELGLLRPTPVGLFESGRSPVGAYDMVGNVAEWTTTRSGVEVNERHLVLGGSFLSRLEDTMDPLVLVKGSWVPGPQALKGPGTQASYIGFRCALDASAVEGYREVSALVRQLGIRDPLGELLEVRPAMDALEGLHPRWIPFLEGVRRLNVRQLVRRRLDAVIRCVQSPEGP